jgi:hypothetical protein
MHEIRVDCRVTRPAVVKLGGSPTNDQVRSKYLFRLVNAHSYHSKTKSTLLEIVFEGEPNGM